MNGEERGKEGEKGRIGRTSNPKLSKGSQVPRDVTGTKERLQFGNESTDAQTNTFVTPE